MMKLTNFVTRPLAAATMAALLAVCLLPGVSPAAMIVDDGGTLIQGIPAASEIAFAVSSTDLLEVSLDSQSTNPAGLTFGAGTNLNDGTAGIAGNIGTAAADTTAGGWSATFNLDVLTNTLGYDISSIATYTGWNSSGNIDQSYELFVKTVTSGVFNSVGSFAFDATIDAPNTAASTRLILTDDVGDIFTGVDALRFDFPALDGSSTGVYREIDVFGAATIPEPASFALMALGLVGMISLRKRNRC